jgi:hypothetical protein
MSAYFIPEIPRDQVQEVAHNVLSKFFHTSRPIPTDIPPILSGRTLKYLSISAKWFLTKSVDPYPLKVRKRESYEIFEEFAR